MLLNFWVYQVFLLGSSAPRWKAAEKICRAQSLHPGRPCAEFWLVYVNSKDFSVATAILTIRRVFQGLSHRAGVFVHRVINGWW